MSELEKKLNDMLFNADLNNSIVADGCKSGRENVTIEQLTS